MNTCPYCGAALQDSENFCRNCGNVIGAAQNQPPQPSPYPKQQTMYVPSNYANQAKKKLSKTAKIVLCIVLVIAIIALSVSIGAIVYTKKFKQEVMGSKSDYEEMLRRFTEKQMVAFYYDDYDANGTNEAFAVVGDGDEDTGEYEDADLWYVNEDTTEPLNEHMTGHTNGIIQSGDIKYVSLENELRAEDADTEDSYTAPEGQTTASFIYGVKDEQSFEPAISGVYRNVRQQGTSIVADSPDSDQVVFLVMQEDGELKAELTDLPAKDNETTTTRSAFSATTTTTTKKQAASLTPTQSEWESLEDLIYLVFDVAYANGSNNGVIFDYITYPWDSAVYEMIMGYCSGIYGSYFYVEDTTEQRDPLRLFHVAGHDWQEFDKYPEDKVKFILKNVLNINTYESPKKDTIIQFHESEQRYYLHDHVFYTDHFDGAEQSISDCNIKNKTQLSDGKYEVTGKYDGFADDFQGSRFKAIVELKKIDGKNIWSVYKITVI